MGASSVNEHREAAPEVVRFAVLTVSDTRTLATDKSGSVLVELLTSAGHVLLDRRLVQDEPAKISASVISMCDEHSPQALLITGGTGLGPRDQTPEAVLPLIDAVIPGFGELFRLLSFEEIGAAAMLSRAFAGRRGRVLIFCLPGSTAACRLAAERLLVPELPHLVHHAGG